MAGNRKTRNATQKRNYTTYEAEGRHSKNKKRRLLAHLKRHPNDSQTKAALANCSSYKRRKPGSVGSCKHDKVRAFGAGVVPTVLIPYSTKKAMEEKAANAKKSTR